MDMKGDDYFKDTETKSGSRFQNTRKECQFIWTSFICGVDKHLHILLYYHLMVESSQLLDWTWFETAKT